MKKESNFIYILLSISILALFGILIVSVINEINFGYLGFLLFLLCLGGERNSTSGYGGEITPGPKSPLERERENKNKY